MALTICVRQFANVSDRIPIRVLRLQMTEELLKKLGSANWKDRAAALDAVHAAIRGAGGRISPALGDLTAGLKVTLPAPAICELQWLQCLVMW
jgi:hypothetical protein